MPDTRTRREKLEAMASQHVSPAEAEIARAKLADIPAPRTLSRAQILAAPDLRANVVPVRVWDASARVWVVVDSDQMDRRFARDVAHAFGVDLDAIFSDPALDWDPETED